MVNIIQLNAETNSIEEYRKIFLRVIKKGNDNFEKKGIVILIYIIIFNTELSSQFTTHTASKSEVFVSFAILQLSRQSEG